MESPPILIYRLGRTLHKLRLKKIAWTITWINRFLFATFIPSSAEIGRNFKAGYWGLGIVIHKNSIIGENCWIGQNVTVGRKEGDTNVPIIGDNVYIGTGSVVVGEISIGTNVIIGANSFVNKSVPPDTVVAGNPAKFIKNNKTDPKDESL